MFSASLAFLLAGGALAGAAVPAADPEGVVAVDERFAGAPAGWLPVVLAGAAGRSSTGYAGGRLEISAGGDGAFALCHTLPQAGGFFAEASFDREADCGVVLVREKNGKPDPANFIAVLVARDAVPVGNLALRRPAKASSSVKGNYARNGVDGRMDSRWESAYSDPQSYEVDLGAVRHVAKVVIRWEAAYASSYTLELSDDGVRWRKVVDVTDGRGGVAEHALNGRGRHVRLTGRRRGAEWGYSLYEFEVAPAEPVTEERTVVRVVDRQNGRDNVLDSTGKMNREWYREILDGQYSVPFRSTTGKVRIVRDGHAGSLRFLYSVGADIRGRRAEGWMELAPAPDPGGRGGRWFAGVLARGRAGASFNGFRIVRPPWDDRKDNAFRAVRRPFAWSGVSGNAVVVSFGPEFPWRGRGVKLVFWDLANRVPAWRLSNQLLFFYEFVEIWGGGNVGCHEPMSDRLLRFSEVSILEDNEARKVVRWWYVPVNPDYRVPADEEGEQLPEVEERWTMYPDGTGTRMVRYTPKLDTWYRGPHELYEFIAVAGSLGNPEDHLRSPALAVANLGGGTAYYHPRGNPEAAPESWKEVVASALFREGPDAFMAFSRRSGEDEAAGPYPPGFDVSWHGTGYQMAHWPVNLEPYRESDGIKTHGTWPFQVSHTSLVTGGVGDGDDWESSYKTDARGRRYREWTFLVGLTNPGDMGSARARTAAWLKPGKVETLDSGCEFVKASQPERALVFSAKPGATSLRFRLVPEGGEKASCPNPVIVVTNWPAPSAKLSLNGVRLVPGRDFRRAVEGGNLVVWVNRSVRLPAEFSLVAARGAQYVP